MSTQQGMGNILINPEAGLDEYWTALADFLRASPSAAGVTLAPSAVAQAIPGLTPFAAWDEDQTVGRVVIHKGLIEEIPDGLLEGFYGDARASFANEVFVAFDITPTRDEHVRAAQIALREKARC
ncbi:MAG: hypothetical protein JO110_17955 [Acetobacteraceae bacterium]|nr:hypothetical protein [Acetobacteraceae bacterium]